MSPTLQIGHQHHILTYSYVDDRLAFHQHAENVTNILFFVTNITVTVKIDVLLHLKIKIFDFFLFASCRGPQKLPNKSV